MASRIRGYIHIMPLKHAGTYAFLIEILRGGFIATGMIMSWLIVSEITRNDQVESAIYNP